MLLSKFDAVLAENVDGKEAPVSTDLVEQLQEELPRNDIVEEKLETDELAEGVDRMHIGSRDRENRPSKSSAAAAAAMVAVAAAAAEPEKENMNIIFIGHVGKSCASATRSVCEISGYRCWEVNYWRSLDVSHWPS